MSKLLRQSITMLFLMTLITGVIYPLAVTGIGQVLFSHAANGSLLEREGKPLGSELIGQPFSEPKYFWPRPSATAPSANNALASSGSNLGPTNPALADAVKQRVDALRGADPGGASLPTEAGIPVDLLTASGSGLDPQISPAAAQFQVGRVARARGLDVAAVTKLVADATEGRQLGVLGEPRVNVLRLNLALDASQK